ncbi:EP300-interacting inhibitor of differentiation 3 [Bulinus truncatus]|nr:EP300-interacting inhibitor of differentiation 3 [Bulinus truncatus]
MIGPGHMQCTLILGVIVVWVRNNSQGQLGAKTCCLRLQSVILTGSGCGHGHPSLLELAHGHFCGQLVLAHRHFCRQLELAHRHFCGQLELAHRHFCGQLELAHRHFCGQLVLAHRYFCGQLVLAHRHFCGQLVLAHRHFLGQLELAHRHFCGQLVLAHRHFCGQLVLAHRHFCGQLELAHRHFCGQLDSEGLLDEEYRDVLGSIQNPQNEIDRKRIRENYRHFQDDLREQRQELINPDNEQDLLTNKVLEVDQLFNDVQMTREGALDSASLVNLSELGKTKAQALKTNFLVFNATEFCEKVKVVISGNASSDMSHNFWTRLGKAVNPFFKRAPVLRFMCGTFEKGEAAVNQRRRLAREKDKETEKIEKASRPTQLSSFAETERGELTTAQVEHLLKTLWDIYEKNENSPVCYFEFVTHPSSFGQTVENMFYVSFLIRDGHARIFLDGDDLPVIEPVQQKNQSLKDRSQKSQIIISITPLEWKEIVKTFGIEEPVIKNIRKEQILEHHSTELSSDSTAPNYEGKGKGKGKKTSKEFQ